MKDKTRARKERTATVVELRRVCPCCHERRIISVTEPGDGREIWDCHACGGRKVYRVG